MAGGSGPRSVTKVAGGGRSGPYTVGRSTSHVSAVGVGKRSPSGGSGPRSVSKSGRGDGSGPTCAGGGLPPMTKKAYSMTGSGPNVGGQNATVATGRVKMEPKGRLLSTEKDD